MELLLSSPVPVAAGVIFVIIFIGVFLYELRQQKRQREAPPTAAYTPPPAPKPQPHIPPPVAAAPTVGLKKKSHQGVVVASFITMFLLAAVGATVYLASQQQQVFNFAQAPPVSPTSPLRPSVDPTTKEIALAKPSTTAPLPTITLPALGGPTCSKLTADPHTGEAPLQVTFTAEGQAPNSEVSAFQFIFGDGMEKTIERSFGPNAQAKQQVIYAYQQKGIYRASLRVREKGGNWSSTPVGCIVSITVNDSTGAKAISPTVKALGGASASSSATPTLQVVVKPKIPESGNFTPTLIFAVGGVLLVGLSTLVLRF